MSAKKVEPGDHIPIKCKKCKKTTKHIVVALVDNIPSKVQCTMCKGNYKHAKAKVKPTAKTPKAPKITPHMKEWLSESVRWKENKARPYSARDIYRKNDLIIHPDFGLGQVRNVVRPQRMRVLFEAGEKLMLCGEA